MTQFSRIANSRCSRLEWVPGTESPVPCWKLMAPNGQVVGSVSIAKSGIGMQQSGSEERLAERMMFLWFPSLCPPGVSPPSCA
jgi:hypothetical protein